MKGEGRRFLPLHLMMTAVGMLASRGGRKADDRLPSPSMFGAYGAQWHGLRARGDSPKQHQRKERARSRRRQMVRLHPRCEG